MHEKKSVPLQKFSRMFEIHSCTDIISPKMLGIVILTSPLTLLHTKVVFGMPSEFSTSYSEPMHLWFTVHLLLFFYIFLVAQ